MTFRKVRSLVHWSLGLLALGCAAEETLVVDADAGRAPPDTGPARRR